MSRPKNPFTAAITKHLREELPNSWVQYRVDDIWVRTPEAYHELRMAGDRVYVTRHGDPIPGPGSSISLMQWQIHLADPDSLQQIVNVLKGLAGRGKLI